MAAPDIAPCMLQTIDHIHAMLLYVIMQLKFAVSYIKST